MLRSASQEIPANANKTPGDLMATLAMVGGDQEVNKNSTYIYNEEDQPTAYLTKPSINRCM